MRLFTGIAAASVTDLLEQGDGAAADYGDGTVSVAVPARGTVTLAVDPAPDLGRLRGLTGRRWRRPERRQQAHAALLSPAQPVFTRYWLHGKGPGPGRQPAGRRPPVPWHRAARSRARPPRSGSRVACGPAPVSGTVTLGVPAGLRPGRPVRPAGPAGLGPGHGGAGRALSGPLHYHLASHGFAAWDLVRRRCRPGSGRPGTSSPP